MKLYEIANEYRAVNALLEESDGEVTPEVEAAMAGLEGSLQEKVDAIVGLIREADAERDALDEEAARFKERAGFAESRSRRLRAYLLDNLKRSEVAKVKTLRFTVSAVKASRPSISWDGDPDNLPDRFRRDRSELNGPAAWEAYKEVGSLPAGFKVTYSEYLQVR